MAPFQNIRARAETRKGGAEALARLLAPKPDPKPLPKLRDDRALAEMTRRVFSAGFAWSVIESKWPGFEEAFLGFEPARLAFEPDEFWDGLVKDARIVRIGAKIASVRQNARFVLEVAKEHGSFGAFLADWPPSDEAGLLEILARRGSRLGGNSGQMLLRFLGYDVTSKDVVACLRDAGGQTPDDLDLRFRRGGKRNRRRLDSPRDGCGRRHPIAKSHSERQTQRLAGFLNAAASK